MISRGIIERFYDAATIQRWNDHVRPVEMTELDKQAHKLMIAYVIGRFEETEGKAGIDWVRLIEGGVFEFLHRVILTDIKPPVFHRMMAEKGKELNQYVIRTLEKDMAGIGDGFAAKFERYFGDAAYAATERRILKAAHYLATNWEFKIVYTMCPFVYGIEKTKEEIENQIEDHYDLIGVQKLSLGKKSFGFIDLCGQLRFQQRWAQTPRIPKTSVLGHMLIVAMTAYLCALEVSACRKRIYNDFFGALFHDLPEVLTRDIVSPVKDSVPGLDRLIKEYEVRQVEERLLPLLPQSWHREVRYFINDEFENKIVKDGAILKVGGREMRKYNRDEFSPLDGVLIKACDKLAAFIEASLSIKHGMLSERLEEGKEKAYREYRGKVVGGVNFGQLFDYFE